MVDLGLRAGLAFTIGLGHPAGDRRLRLAAPAGAARRPRLPRVRRVPRRRRSSASRSTPRSRPRTSRPSSRRSEEERNLIYLSPLMLIGTALVLRVAADRLAASSPRRRRSCSSSSARSRSSSRYPYFEAPGFAILDDPEPALALGRRRPAARARRRARAVGCSLLAFRRRRGVAAAAVVLVRRVDADRRRSRRRSASTHFANQFRRTCRRRSTGSTATRAGSRSTYLGQEIKDPNGAAG